MQASDEHRLFVVAGPQGVAVLPEKVSVVFEKLLQARPSYADKLELHLLRSSGDPAPLHYVLFAAPCRMRHLLDHAVFAGQEPAAEGDRAIVDDLA